MFRAALATALLALALVSPSEPSAKPVRVPEAKAFPMERSERSPGCSQYKTYQTCNADPRCMWYAPPGPCGRRLE